MEIFKHKIKEILSQHITGCEIVINTPPNEKMGDLCLPCFAFAKVLKKSPNMIAEELKDFFKNVDFVDKIEVAGPYLNFFLKREKVIENILNEIESKRDVYGSSMSGKGKKALIEHTSINPNASPHIGRARNAMIGDCIVRFLKFEGFEVDTQYFVNDVGKQIAMLVLGAEKKSEVNFNNLLEIYIDINEKIKENPELEEEVFKLLYKFENDEDNVREKFREVVDICIKGQTAILNKLGIEYDTFKYESDYIFEKRTNEILKEFEKTGKLEEDKDGRLVLNQEEYKLPMKAPYLVLTRKDKTSLYPLRDIAYTIDKIKENEDYNFVVLGEDQKLYFKQICAALDLIGYKTPTSVHYSFVLLTEGKMSTRNGAVVLLEDFMKEAVTKVIDHMKKNKKKVDEKAAEVIAYGAVKYAIMKVSSEKNVTFDWESALSFNGDSGPYIQYSYTRINSILNKSSDILLDNADFSYLKEDAEYTLVKELAKFDAAVKKALEEFSPNIIAKYVYGLAKKFSTFYHECPVISAEDEEVKKARLLLIKSVKQVIKNALNLIGIEVVDYM